MHWAQTQHGLSTGATISLADVATAEKIKMLLLYFYVLLYLYLSPVYTGNKVKFNAVDFVERSTNRQQS